MRNYKERSIALKKFLRGLLVLLIIALISATFGFVHTISKQKDRNTVLSFVPFK